MRLYFYMIIIAPYVNESDILQLYNFSVKLMRLKIWIPNIYREN